MTVRRFSFCAAFISVLCVIALTFASCGISDITHFVGDIIGGESEYSYSLLNSRLTAAAEKNEPSCTIKFATDGKNYSDTVNNDINRIFEEDEYFAYYVDRVTMNYSSDVYTATVVCDISYANDTVLRDEIIDVSSTDLEKACEIAEAILQTGSQTVAFHSANGFDDDTIQTILNTVSINSGTAYTFSDYECMYYPKDSRKILLLDFISNIPENQREALNEQLYQKVSEIAAKIAAENARENKKRLCLAIHNYICENARYDYDIVSESVQTDEAMIARSAYGALIGGKTVCSGYSSAFYLLYNEIIGDGECKIVAGKQGEGDDAVGHAWNVVYDNGEQYYIDCTFDDHDDGGYDFDYFYEPTDSDNFKHHIIEKDYILE